MQLHVLGEVVVHHLSQQHCDSWGRRGQRSGGRRDLPSRSAAGETAGPVQRARDVVDLPPSLKSRAMLRFGRLSGMLSIHT